MDKIERATKYRTLSGFEKKLTALINKSRLENYSNTPDFILADYLMNCLMTYEKIHNDNEE